MPFGSILPGAETGLYAALGAVLLLAAFEGTAAAARAVRWPLAGLLALAAFGALQAVPLPRAVIGWLSPEHLRLADGAARLGAEAGGVALSLAPAASLRAALAVLAFAAALVGGAVAGRTRVARRLLLGALVCAALVEAFVGAQLWFARSRMIWGVPVPTQPWRLHGTFVNPDHLASYLEIVLAACSAWAWWAWRRGAAGERLDRRLLLLAGPVLAWGALFLALAFSGSRAGMVGALAGLLAQGIALAWRERRFGPALAGAGIGLLGVGIVASVGLREGLGRFSQVGAADVSLGARYELTRATLTLWERFPVLGAGLGSFPEAFPLIEPARLSGATWTHAHNDPVELLATGGALAVACGVFAAAALVVRLRRNLERGSRSEDRAAALAALGALASLGLHELAEFGLTVPATAVTLGVVCGAAAVVPWARAHHGTAAEAR